MYELDGTRNWERKVEIMEMAAKRAQLERTGTQPAAAATGAPPPHPPAGLTLGDFGVNGARLPK